MKTTLLAASFFFALPLVAQEGARSVESASSPSHALPQPVESEALKKNIMIRLNGTTTTGADVDLSLSGIGPRFIADQVVNDDTLLMCQYEVSEVDTGYRVSYTVGARIKIPTQGNSNTTSYEYRDITVIGTILCSKDTPQVLVRNGTKSLNLTITENTE